jgi:hypothetical protein
MNPDTHRNNYKEKEVTMPDCEPETVHAIWSAISLLGDTKLQDALNDNEQYPDALQKLALPSGAREPLLHLLNRVERHQSQASSYEEEEQASNKADDDEIEKTQLEAFSNLRAAFWISMSMSIGLFIVGLVLTGFAVYQAMRQTSASALVIGGLGLADFVLLFFRRPWQDISVNLSKTQQVRTIATTYLVGLTFIQRQDRKALDMLDELTNNTVKLLEQCTGEGNINSTKPVPR